MGRYGRVGRSGYEWGGMVGVEKVWVRVGSYGRCGKVWVQVGRYVRGMSGKVW